LVDDRPSRPRAAITQIAHVVELIRTADEAVVEDTVRRVSRTHRYLAPLALVVGGLVMLLDGLKLLVSNWRLTLVQLLPAVWIWLAMADLRAHALGGASFRINSGPLLAVAFVLITLVTAASFFLNVVFAYAISEPGIPDTRRGRARAWEHRRVVLTWGTGLGVLLAFSTVVVDRWGTRWFALCLGIVVGLMMVVYVAVPSRLIGVPKSTRPRRERITASVVSGAVSAAVSTPPYALGRIGLLMLGSSLLAIPGFILFLVGAALQAGAISSVKAVKLSATFVAARHADATTEPDR
jgi:hypothetical protein